MSSENVHLHRPKAAVDSGMAYRVWLDGRRVGKLREGRALDLSVEPGRHELQLRAFLWRSQPVAFDVAPGEHANFLGRPFDPDNTLGVFYRMFATPHHYMDLTRAETPDR